MSYTRPLDSLYLVGEMELIPLLLTSLAAHWTLFIWSGRVFPRSECNELNVGKPRYLLFFEPLLLAFLGLRSIPFRLNNSLYDASHRAGDP